MLAALTAAHHDRVRRSIVMGSGQNHKGCVHLTERSPFLSAGWSRYQTRGLSFANYDGSSLPRKPMGARIGLGSFAEPDTISSCRVPNTGEVLACQMLT